MKTLALALLVMSAGTALAKTEHTIAIEGDAEGVDLLRGLLESYVDVCQTQDLKGAYTIVGRVDTKGALVELTTTPSNEKLRTCVKDSLGNSWYGTRANGTTFRARFVFTGCVSWRYQYDADKQFSAADYAGAVKLYQRAFACPDAEREPDVMAKATLAACHAGNAKLANTYFQGLPPSVRTRLEMLCAAQHVTVARKAPRSPARLDKLLAVEGYEPTVSTIKGCGDPYQLTTRLR